MPPGWISLKSSDAGSPVGGERKATDYAGNASLLTMTMVAILFLPSLVTRRALLSTEPPNMVGSFEH